MSELDFNRSEYDRAEQSGDENELSLLSEHTSRFIRARVAGNPGTSRSIRDRLYAQAGIQTGIIGWLLGNPAFTREEFEIVYTDYLGRSYDGNVHISLAMSRHATTRELGELLRINHWCVTMAVLNNYKERDRDEYCKIIKSLMPKEDREPSEWSEEEKLAYFRTTGKRRPNRL